MAPLLKDSELVLVCSICDYAKNNVVVFGFSDDLFIKMIDSVRSTNTPSVGDFKEYWLIGINDKVSFDSRDYGWIPDSLIRGRVIFCSTN
jgi:type IV secretory pathway protease TraF